MRSSLLRRFTVEDDGRDLPTNGVAVACLSTSVLLMWLCCVRPCFRGRFLLSWVEWDVSPTNNLNGNTGLLTRISVRKNGELSLDGSGLDDEPIRLAAPVQAIIAPNAIV
ncbi:hypothetical protein ACFX1S_041148 [Malus domestica]